MRPITEQSLLLEKEEVEDFAGRNDARLQELEKEFNTKIVLRGNIMKVIGPDEDVDRALQTITDMLRVHRRGGGISPQQFRSFLRHHRGHHRSDKGEGLDKPLSELLLDEIPVPLKRRSLSPITAGQKRYIEAIRKHDIVFGIGPAGTGKTYLAVAMAVSQLLAGRISRIILCRPAVEAGEKLGFLPGDLQQKLDPYVRPLYDALYEMMEAERIKQALETGVIEIAPLAFMRGRTLNNSFVILDEGQNTTPEQMKMFLTRLGFESKAVITGDVTQIDLPRQNESGLLHVQRVIKQMDGVAFVHFDERDVVRHDLVMKIVKAYEKYENGGSAQGAKAQPD